MARRGPRANAREIALDTPPRVGYIRPPVEVGRGLRRTGAALIALASSLVVGVAPAAATPNYVALGDSYTAGPLIPNQQLTPLGCLRSDRNYPHVAAPGIGLPLRDASCSGAKTTDMTHAQGVTPGPNPPQFDRLDADTRVVTLGIGGNDIGFASIILNCATATPFGHPCRDRYTAGGTDQLAARIAATGPLVGGVLQGIRARSPLARIYVANYLPILPETGIGCWPQVPIAWADVGYVRSVERNLNAMLAAQASANGARVDDAYANAVGHDACKGSSTRWVEPTIPATLAAPFHPNADGMAATARAVVAAVGAG
jgi:lysophospholipase L1-like esterase